MLAFLVMIWLGVGFFLAAARSVFLGGKHDRSEILIAGALGGLTGGLLGQVLEGDSLHTWNGLSVLVAALVAGVVVVLFPLLRRRSV